MSSLKVLINGKTPTEYLHNGDRFIEGREGSKFSLHIYNPSWKRTKAVVSVDGLSVLDGEVASDDSKGYMINGYSTLTIDGWQISDNERKAFVFKGIGNSYNAKTGNDTRNIGVIAVKLFNEAAAAIYQPLRTWNPIYPTTPQWPYDGSYWGVGQGTTLTYGGIGNGGTSTSCGYSITPTIEETETMSLNHKLNSMTISNSIGAGQGETLHRPVKDVQFNAESYASVTELVYYDDIRGLERRGIDVKRINYRPNPFPGNPGYCKVV